jgi:hypothetical protein
MLPDDDDSLGTSLSAGCGNREAADRWSEIPS